METNIVGASLFDNIKHIDDEGNEYWYARELQKILDYSQWRSLNDLINKAKNTCNESGNNINDHFALCRKMVDIGSESQRMVLDYKLSRYACYLIVMNGNPTKKIIALGQTYFAIQTRKQELYELEYDKLSEDDKRIYHRNITKKKNYLLDQTALKSGVKNFGKFHNSGYKGLYNGETADDIAKRKKLKYREEILDYMSSGELVANQFRIIQTEEALRNKNINKENDANNIHYKIGKNIRNVIIKNGTTLPENYKTPGKSIKEIEKVKNKELKP